ncbi:DUF4097 family beta strand repeat-containing protein [Kitasatospora sp. NPDC090091]|uniref:DUF4097 family beta strand repeat-containing protein n=1 Tax=Kitasatospora sp. NPDC090091 TaxID=3364081 RepID=UPI00382E67E4
MREGRVWRTVGALSLAAVLVVGAVQTWAVAVQQQTVSERTYPVAATRVVLDTGPATVVVKPGVEGQTVVRRRLDWTVRKPVVSAEFLGSTLTVTMRCNQVLPGVDVSCGALIELEVPPSAAVEGQGSSGSLQVSGLSGEVRLSSTSGEIRMNGISGSVVARTTSGSVRGRGLTSAQVEVGATSGSVSLDFARPPHLVDVGATSGSVELVVPKGSRYAFTGEAGSGSRHVDPLLADSSSPDRVRVAVTSGSVSAVSSDG